MTRKMAVLALMTIALSACGKAQQLEAHWTGDAAETCHAGVVYLQFTSGASVKYLPDGKIATCTK